METNKLARRRLLAGLLISPVVGLNPAWARSCSVQCHPDVVTELTVLLEQWLQHMGCLPSEYLESRGIDISDRDLLKTEIAGDFRRGETIEINGLVLGKSEAAVLAEFAVMVTL